MRANGEIVMITAGHCFGLNGGSDKEWTHHGDRIADSGLNTWSPHDHNPPDPDCNPNLAHPIGCDLAETDVGVFQFPTDPAYVPLVYNKIAILNKLTSPDSLAIGAVISWTYSSAQPTNGQVCRTGALSFNDSGFPPCGQITRTNHWEWSCLGPGTMPPCAAIDNESRVDIDTTAGDSGGPYYSPPVCAQPDPNPPYCNSWTVSLYGIATHSVNDNSTPKRAWYTPTSSITSGLANEIGVNVDRFCVGATCPPVMCFTWGCGP
jgi:hypothetical protein